MLTGNVLVTGGSGYLGRAILAKARREEWPAKFTVLSRDETKQWELKHKYPEVTCILGSVAEDISRLTAAFTGMDYILHAGAVKYIPEAEFNVFETINTNVIGSQNVIFAAIAAGVKRVVGISTDKATSPLNVYGMTKGLMERMFGEAARRSRYTEFVTVRYGNVIGSTGSVIPLFRRQIKELGKITLTHPEMTRFWMSAFEAVTLIEDATTWQPPNTINGSTLIYRCQAMKMLEVAEAVRELEQVEVPIEIVGMRPGEKLHEFLWNEQEAARMDMHGEMFRILRPATETSNNSKIKVIGAYSSEFPSHWESKENMIINIREAETL